MFFQFISVFALIIGINADCDTPSVTTVKGSKAPEGKICPEQLIFGEEFDTLDTSVWSYESTQGGANNGEFQWYVDSGDNSYVQDGQLYLKPTVVDSDQAVHSALIRTRDTFEFKYGRVEIRAQIPAGDWLWPALWMLPNDNAYGNWPASGEIDIMESRGNRELKSAQGQLIGVQQVGQTLHWGPSADNDAFSRAHYESNLADGYNAAMHTYQIEWAPDHLSFSVDGSLAGSITPPAGGFWELGQFQGTNPWDGQSVMAPFDKEFYFILNVAVGGTNFFPDDASNPGGKPWRNDAGNPSGDFWNGRNQWLPTWTGDDVAMKVDYIRVWAL